MSRIRRRALIACVAVLSACSTVAPRPANSLSVENLRRLPEQNYKLAPETAEIGFAARPMAMPAVRGSFSRFGGEIAVVNAAKDSIAISAVVDLDSVETGSDFYQNMIKSDAWFDVERHPEAKFNGAIRGWDGDGVGRVEGELTIRGVTRPALFLLQLNCDALEACPMNKVGFNGSIEISRSEFGMTAMKGLVRDKVELSFTGALTSAGN